MAKWTSRVKVKHLLMEKEDHASIQASMTAIADVLAATPAFSGFSVKRFREIPEGDGVISPVDYANRLLDRMYDYADRNLIWIE
jgi:hypothetical protein